MWAPRGKPRGGSSAPRLHSACSAGLTRCPLRSGLSPRARANAAYLTCCNPTCNPLSLSSLRIPYGAARVQMGCALWASALPRTTR
jgi:hypothetical protein